MGNMTQTGLAAGVALALAAWGTAGPARAETLVGSNVDSRVVVALDVEDSAAQAWLPDGWSVTPFGGGPFEGADTLLIGIDQHVGYDGAGSPTDPQTRQAVVLVHLAADAVGAEQRVFVTRTYTTTSGGDPYGSDVVAEVSRSATLDASSGEAPRRGEAWTVDTGDGTLTLDLEYESGGQSWSDAAARPYSAADPGFFRIYEIMQLTDLAMSAPLGRELAGEVAIETTIPELAPMLDGSERIVAVLAIPVYVREVYLP